MSPKSLLRHPSVRSNFDEMGPNTTFKELIPDTVKNLKEVKKIILCSGKVFYELLTLREEKKLTEQIAILRLEQICPFPYSLVAQEIAKYPKSKITWMQEEHKNQGAFYYVRERIANALGIKIEEVKYAGRQCSASPATGSKVIYQNEHKTMMEDAMKLS
ncbi:2-oxoglutarate dehydrogenase complex component E1-like [Prorops nasuta]|uniref:2-oxoglutarate dehydrogenase complex component E1-like n=1 Tax=Prorops nasuta TaxID=863751 RepID=UPI0034CDFEC5